jgi:hypothetical protein
MCGIIFLLSHIFSTHFLGPFKQVRRVEHGIFGWSKSNNQGLNDFAVYNRTQDESTPTCEWGVPMLIVWLIVMLEVPPLNSQGMFLIWG